MKQKLIAKPDLSDLTLKKSSATEVMDRLKDFKFNRSQSQHQLDDPIEKEADKNTFIKYRRLSNNLYLLSEPFQKRQSNGRNYLSARAELTHLDR